MENLFEYYLKTENLHLKYACGEPTIKNQEFHDYNEFVFFLSGEAGFLSKNIQQELVPGSIIVIPKEHFHQFCVNSPETYTRLILGFYATPETENLIREVMDTIKIISVPDPKIFSIFDGLKQIVKSSIPEQEKNLYLHSCLIQLLVHLKLNPPTTIKDNVQLSPIVSSALNIIDENYSEALSVETIANSLFVSPSTLSHKFSKELNISVYKYIIKKRLSVAHEFIKQGASFTTAASSSGFNDYSCFYRLYKKYYKN